MTPDFELPEAGVRGELELDAERGRRLLEETPEIVLLLDDQGRLLRASRRARETLGWLVEGETVPEELLQPEPWRPHPVPLELADRRELLLYLREPGELAAYEELRAGFTAAVSHELRTPLARLLALLETAVLPSADTDELIGQAKVEVEQIRELIDDVLFLSELETGRAVVSLTSTRAAPVVQGVVDSLRERASRAGVFLESALDPEAEVPLRPRMLRVVVENLAENAIRYAGDGTRFKLSVDREGDGVALTAEDDGAGVSDHDLQRLFERFYRADRARASRGSGLGLAIVKHIVTSAGGTVQATGGLGRGLAIRVAFPA
jgi:two-component system, OmpR family, phosphate regulon sensor histidine kinase PhoR